MSVPAADGGFLSALISVRAVHIAPYQMRLDDFSDDTEFQAAVMMNTNGRVPHSVPVLRVFGCTPAGQKACVHVHRLRPYLYVPLPVGVDAKCAVSFAAELHPVLEAAIESSLAAERTTPAPASADTSAAPRFIDMVEPTLRTSIYGYHPEPSVFLRIKVYNPSTIRRLASLFERGEGLGAFSCHDFQPFESNFNFTLQALTDLDLVGMGYINLRACKFRHVPHAALPTENPSDGNEAPLSAQAFERIFTVENVRKHDSSLMWPFGTVERHAKCDIELDAFSEDILNASFQLETGPDAGQLSGPAGYAAKTLQALWDEERIRIGQKPAVPSEPKRRVSAGPALSEPRLREKLLSLIEESICGIDSLNDVIDHLDSSVKEDDVNAEVQLIAEPSLAEKSNAGSPIAEPPTAKPNSGPILAVDEMWSDDSVRDYFPDNGSSDDNDDWENIRDSQQPTIVPVPNIPQGDGSGYAGFPLEDSSDDDRRPKKRLKRAVRPPRYVRPTDGVAPDSKGDLLCGQTDHHRSQVTASPFGRAEQRSSQDADPSGAHRETFCSLSGSDKISVQQGGSHLLGERHLNSLEGKSTSRKGPAVFPEEESRSHARGELSPGEDDVVKSPSDMALVSTQTTTSSGDLELSAELAGCVSCIRLFSSPPSHSIVSCEFGLKGVDPSVVRVPVYFGNPEDATEVAHGSSAYIPRHIPPGGVAGLATVRNRFVEDAIVVRSRESHYLATVRAAPLPSAVRLEVARVDNALKQRQQLLARENSAIAGKSKIDSMGRLVAGPAIDDEFGNTISPDLPNLNGPQALRRVVQTVRKPNSQNESSDSDSVDEIHMSAVLEKSVPDASPARGATRSGEDSPIFNSGLKLRDRSSGSDTLTSRREPLSVTLSCSAGNLHRQQNLCICVVEVLASCRRGHLSDPSCDPVVAVCLWLRDERKQNRRRRDSAKVLFVGERNVLSSGFEIMCFEKEVDLLIGLSKEIESFDPDILSGFETQTQSVGYLMERVDTLDLQEFVKRISRVKVTRHLSGGIFRRSGVDMREKTASARYFQRKGADISVVGRHILNIWRVVRKEVKLASYSLEGIAREVLGVTLSKHSPHSLAQDWFSTKFRDRVIRHLYGRAEVCMRILDKLDIIGRTGELARVYGIDFWSVLTRGSQYWVESMLARVAHPRGFILLAASRDQVKAMPAVECIPLVMEPESSFFADPVIVLDFRSLYPSVIIAHNLCFSTMLGNVNKLSSWASSQIIGVAQGYSAPPVEELEARFGCSTPQEGIYIAPNGQMFVTASHRRGVLPQMLDEILETRVMVKRAMKDVSHPSRGEDVDEDLLKRLNARQFACKLLANVTYGFAGASMSGRMPCSGLADSIVQCGRDALEKVVGYVSTELSESTRAEVVYGDTDSLFVRVRGATKAEAFEVGRLICARAEEMFPSPMKLQLEKVYLPCFLVAKKRYVGYAFESEDTVTPVFDDKGIETVRRDSCPLTQKTLERSLRLFFENGDMSRVKRFFQRTCQRVQRSKLPLSDFIFRKEVKGNESYARDRPVPPARQVANAAVARDSRAEPRHGERVAYVVVYGDPGAALKDCVVAPSVFIRDEREGKARINATYYITRHLIKPLERLFDLTGVRVCSWFAEVPRHCLPVGGAHSRKIASFFDTRRCLICQEWRRSSICLSCSLGEDAAQLSHYTLVMRQRRLDARLAFVNRICLGCVGGGEHSIESISCISLDCPIRFQKIRSQLQLEQLRDALSASEL